MAQGADEYAWSRPDALRALGGRCQHHPHIGAVRRGVLQPGPLVPQALGNGDVLWGSERGRNWLEIRIPTPVSIRWTRLWSTDPPRLTSRASATATDRSGLTQLRATS